MKYMHCSDLICIVLIPRTAIDYCSQLLPGISKISEYESRLCCYSKYTYLQYYKLKLQIFRILTPFPYLRSHSCAYQSFFTSKSMRKSTSHSNTTQYRINVQPCCHLHALRAQRNVRSVYITTRICVCVIQLTLVFLCGDSTKGKYEMSKRYWFPCLSLSVIVFLHCSLIQQLSNATVQNVYSTKQNYFFGPIC